ncbi:MAG TPA: hypothetical protein VHA33_13395 [Candidatus Angelobacter sp.]|nr:hypothetical protein [Candidatus Angelobacter sp.]
MNRYLLGQVSQEERDGFEDQYLADDDLYEELVAAENDLIDAYIKGKLSKIEQKQFETHFLNSPERHERVDFAKSLASYGAARQGTGLERNWSSFFKAQPAAVRFAAAAMFLVIAGGLLWMMVDNSLLRREVTQSRQELQGLRQEVARLQESLNAVSPRQELAQMDPPGSARLSLVLAAVARGGGQQNQNTVFIFPGISTVAFRLNRKLEDDSSYSVSLETVEGATILKKSDLKGHPAADGGKVITAEFPAKDLPPGDYVLKLHGTTAAGKTEELDAYSFRALK